MFFCAKMRSCRSLKRCKEDIKTIVLGFLQVLQSIPWDKVDIRFMVIEVEWAGRIFDSKVSDIHQLLTDKGYVHLDTIDINHIFAKKDFLRPDVVRSFKSYLEVKEESKSTVSV